MILNNYETIYILKPDVAENTNLALVNNYKSLIKHSGGQDIIIQHRGRRHLSYKIMHYYDGIYVQMNYSGNGHLVRKLERQMQINDSIMRYITIKTNI